MRAFGQEFPYTDRPQTSEHWLAISMLPITSIPTIMLNFTTVHQKWGIHSTLLRQRTHALALARGPHYLAQRQGRESCGIEDNDWVEFWNANGAMVARAILTSRMPEGLSILQHATEKIMNTPASNVTGIRGGRP